MSSMEYSSQQTTPSSDQNATPLVQYPGAACKSLRRRCSDKCVLAPYFPSSEPLRFTIVRKIFGAGNIIRRLQEIPEHQRTDAMNSMVYEAAARIRDPVYGCTGLVTLLRQQILGLQAELAEAQADIVNMQCQTANSVSIICTAMFPSQEQDIISISEQQQDLINVSEQQQDLINVSEQQLWDGTSALSSEKFWTHEQVKDI